jgi:Biopolymer transport proteins
MNPEINKEVISSGPDLTILGLFFQADPFVKGVMFLLIFASIWCWAIIFNKYNLLRNERKLSIEFEDIFWSGVNLEDLYQKYSENINNSQVRVFITGMREFNKINQRQTMSSIKLKDFFKE